MESYKEEFITFMVRSRVLTFGDFTTKSGRKTPFFINTGNYSTGLQLAMLGSYYATAFLEVFPEQVNVLFGPAYKGIPLASAVAMTLATTHNRSISFCFNRKEVKDHGEGGTLIGHKLCSGDSVVIIEDVTTAGTSIRESVPMLTAVDGVSVKGLLVSVDRMERGRGEMSALDELRSEFGIVASAIVTLDDVVSFLHNREIDGKVVLDDDMYDKILQYRTIYGARKA